tara:strand:+ start:20 stop:532 length:513 start_codon:yes stop_codon:yes gene_type:complete
MANIVPFSFAQELLKGNHNFTTTSGTSAGYKISLYTNNGGNVGAYTTSSTIALLGPSGGGAPNFEVATSGGTQYAAEQLVTGTVSNSANVATVDFSTDPVWGAGGAGPATFTARGAAIYKNTGTPADDLLVVVLDFTADFSCSNGTFTVTFPAPTAGSPTGTDALLSITS